MSESDILICPSCSALLRPGATQCAECGAVVEAPAPHSFRQPQTLPTSRPTEFSITEDFDPDLLETVDEDLQEIHDAAIAVGNARSGLSNSPDFPSSEIDAEPVDPTMSGEPTATNFLRFFHWRILSWITAASGVIALLSGTVWWFIQPSHLPRSQAVVWERAIPDQHLTSAAFSNDGRDIFAASAEGFVHRGKVIDGEFGWRSEPCGGDVLAIAVGPGDFLLAGSTEPSLCGWSQATSTSPAFQKQSAFAAPIACVGLHPNRAEFVLGLINNDLMFFGNRTPLRRETKHRGGVRVAVWSPDGRKLVTGGAEGDLAWRNGENGETIGVPVSLTATIGAIAFSLDGFRMVAGDWNGYLTVYEAATHKPLAEFAQRDAVSGIVVLRDRIVTTGWDGWLRVWSLDNPRMLQMHSAGGAIAAVAINGTKDRIATVLQDGRLQMWNVAKILESGR